MKRGIIGVLISSFLFFQSQPSLPQEGSDPKLIAEAKKEGEVVWYTSMNQEHSKIVVDQFQKKYPFIKASFYRTGGGALLNKVLTEARAGRFAFDVVTARGESIQAFKEKPLGLLPFAREQNDLSGAL